MDTVTGWIAEFLSDSIAQVLFTLLAIWVAAWLFRWFVYRRVRKHVGESFTWYAIMLRTLETRLRVIDEHLKKNPQWHAGDKTFRRLLRKGLADVEAVDVAGSAVAGLLDLPLVSSRKAMLVVRFEASRARLLSELSRAMQIVDASFDLDDIDNDSRYLSFLAGGTSPVSQGFHGKQQAEQGRDLGRLLGDHLEDCEDLSAEFMNIKPEEAAKRFAGDTYWDNWNGWEKTLRPRRTTGAP